MSPPYVAVPKAVLEQCRTPAEFSAMVQLFIRADEQRGRPFECSVRWLAELGGMSRRSAERLWSVIVDQGLGRVVQDGDRVQARIVAVWTTGVDKRDTSVTPLDAARDTSRRQDARQKRIADLPRDTSPDDPGHLRDKVDHLPHPTKSEKGINVTNYRGGVGGRTEPPPAEPDGSPGVVPDPPDDLPPFAPLLDVAPPPPAPRAPSLFPEPPAPEPKPKARSPKPPKPKPPTDADRGVELLHAVRLDLHEDAMQRKPLGTWCAKGKTRAALKLRVDRFLREVRAEQLGEPLEVLEALARWTYLSDRADWLRDTGEPLDKTLGGKANDPISRMRRAREAIEWHQRGGVDRAPPRRQGGSRREEPDLVTRYLRRRGLDPDGHSASEDPGQYPTIVISPPGGDDATFDA